MDQAPSDVGGVVDRVIAADVRQAGRPFVTAWRRVVGAGRVGEARYAAWQDQLRLCREEIGFEYLRCHGLFHDELGVYRELADGKVVYNFQYIDLVFDFLLSIGVRPFVEFGFMPNDLATFRTELAGRDGQMADPNDPSKKRRVTVFDWRANVTPPKDPAKWFDLVAAITRHWTQRYGADEVSQWLFEIWNEPNHKAFWGPINEANRAQEYFELYAQTARAVKSVNPAYRVGGPAAAGPEWVGELIDFCTKRDVPIDFVTFHMYGLGGGPGGLDEFGDTLLYLNPDLHSVANYCNGQIPVVAQSARPELPIHVTEWSASFSSRDPVHDDYFSAPYILEQLKRTERMSSMSYWTFTDIFEELGIPPRPFHGGFGLINVHGIKKPSYFAYRFLSRLGPQELPTGRDGTEDGGDDHAWVCRDDAGNVQALFWDISAPDLRGRPNQQVFREIRPTKQTQRVTLSLRGLSPGRYRMAVYTVGHEKNDAYTAYLKMGAPDTLDLKQIAELKSRTSDAPEREQIVTIPAGNSDGGGAWEETFPLRQHDVVLVTLTRVE